VFLVSNVPYALRHLNPAELYPIFWNNVTGVSSLMGGLAFRLM
jgi:hypothetical protein